MGGNLNTINQWEEPQKGGWGTEFLKFSGGKQKGGTSIFDLNLVRGKTLEETMILAGTCFPEVL